MKRTKQAQDKRKPKRRPRVESKEKTALKAKLSDLRAFLRGVSDFDKKLAVSSLNMIIACQREAWVEACNLRDRILRGRL